MAPVILGYWDIRGLTQPIRLLLEYTGTDWEDKLYVCGSPPAYDRSSWLNEKYHLELAFPNLPYLIDGNIKLTQSKAILKYIARKHNLVGKTEEEQQRMDLVEYQVEDIRVYFANMCYSPDFESLKAQYLEEQLPEKLEQLSKFLGVNPWFGGKNLSYVDFVTYEILDQHSLLVPTVLKKYKNLEDFVTRFEKFEKISAFIKSPKFIKNRINNRMAKFGG